MGELDYALYLVNNAWRCGRPVVWEDPQGHLAKVVRAWKLESGMCRFEVEYPNQSSSEHGLPTWTVGPEVVKALAAS